MGWIEKMLNRLAPLMFLGGRALLSLIFLISGAGKIANPSGTMAYMSAKGMFAVQFFLVMAILFELGGGLSVLLGFKSRLGALALAGFLVPVTLVFHSFWTYPDAERMMQTINFLKNAAILGGLLVLASSGGEAISVDGFLKKRKGMR